MFCNIELKDTLCIIMVIRVFTAVFSNALLFTSGDFYGSSTTSSALFTNHSRASWLSTTRTTSLQICIEVTNYSKSVVMSSFSIEAVFLACIVYLRLCGEIATPAWVTILARNHSRTNHRENTCVYEFAYM